MNRREFLNAAIAAAGVGGFDDRVLSVRLTGLKPATRYFYRVRTTAVDYAKGGYEKRRRVTETGAVHSFTTCGAAAPSHFAMINATNSVEEAVRAVLTPEVPEKDYAAQTGILFNNGNHEYRGLFMRNPSSVFLPRLSSERPPEFEALVRNYAVRQGDIALIGLDTGEDRPDEHPWHAGLCNCNAYRDAQTKWLEGGGYERRFRKVWTPQGMKDVENPGLFPTVVEGEVRDGKLVITVHDAWHDTVAGRHEFTPRAV